MKSLSIKILGKEYQISCPLGNETELQNAANYLDQKMTDIRNNGRTISFEGILITVAINLAHDLLHQTESLVTNLTSLEHKLDSALQANSLKKLKFEYNDN